MSRFIKVNEAIKLPLLGNDDFLQRGKGRMLTWAPYVFDDLNLQVIKKAVREVFKINKRTHTIDLPCHENDLCSVSAIDHKGTIWPLYRNDRLHADLVQIPADKDCNCEWKCGYKLCNTIKGYEAIQTVKSDTLPNGNLVSFTCVDRKAIDKNGFLYTQTQYPLHIFTDGVWTDTILFTEHKTLCKLECDDKGCICDTEDNINAVCDACGVKASTIPVGGNAECPPNPAFNEWIYHCMSKHNFLHVQCGSHPFFRTGYDNIYNINELGNRLIFPPHFHFDKVLVRYYDVPNRDSLEIPFVSVDTFVAGLKWWDVRWNDNKQNLEQKFGLDYSKLKWGLFNMQNRYTLAEQAIMLFPPRPMPSYFNHRRDGHDRE